MRRQVVDHLLASRRVESEIIVVDVDYDNLENRALESRKEMHMKDSPNENQLAAASALAHTVAVNHEPQAPKFAITTKGSEAFLDEKEQRLQALLDETLKLKNEALDAMNNDLAASEYDANEITTQLSAVDHDINAALMLIADIDADIAEKKTLIESINREIATANEHRQHVVERTMPSLQFQLTEREAKLSAIKIAADGIRAKHAKRVDSASKEHEKLRMRLLRLQLRRPKVAP